jgi:hypothetical protein
LGIGTTSPSQALEIAGSVRIDNGASFTAYEVYRDNILYGSVGGGSNQFTIQASNSKSINLFDDSGVGLTVKDGGNVGIGTSSPFFTTAGRVSLSVNGTSSSILAFGKGGSSENYILADVGGFTIANTSATLPTTFFNNGSNRMTIDSSGNVGIGTSSPSAKLAVVGTTKVGEGVASNASKLMVNTLSGTAAGIQLFQDGVESWIIQNPASTTALTFGNSGTERMRIDSSGNLLVGKTASDLGATAGIELNGQYDVGYFTRSAEKALVVNRLSTDGTIAEFRKDGTTVGSWQSRSSLVSTIVLDPRAGGVGLGATTNKLIPTDNAGTLSNGAIDLGASANRFKDLYLSGGVYLGGTVAANLLDDYEEGTWTPAYTATGGAVTYGTQTGSYTKVGNLVTVIGELRAKRNTLSGNVEITGLPFTNSGNGAGLSVSFASAFATDMPNLRGYTTSTKIALRKNATNTASGTPVANTDLADAATTENYLYFSATYLT